MNTIQSYFEVVKNHIGCIPCVRGAEVIASALKAIASLGETESAPPQREVQSGFGLPPMTIIEADRRYQNLIHWVPDREDPKQMAELQCYTDKYGQGRGSDWEATILVEYAAIKKIISLLNGRYVISPYSDDEKNYSISTWMKMLPRKVKSDLNRHLYPRNESSEKSLSDSESETSNTTSENMKRLEFFKQIIRRNE